MNINDFYIAEKEKPLDRILNNGGFCGIFRTIACIGDSLSSGEFETIDSDGNHSYYDFYDYSWGQYMARMIGSKVYNFSRGGMTAKEYCETFADSKAYWSPKMAAQCYIIALGVNDLLGQKQDVGELEDINLDDYIKNKKTFAGYYGEIIQRVRNISPDAKLFFVTMPKEDSDDEFDSSRKKAHRKLLYNLTEIFGNSYVIDLYQYAPVYDEKFKENFFLNGHMTPAGYLLTARMIASYIDYIIRGDYKAFKTAGFIGTAIESYII